MTAQRPNWPLFAGLAAIAVVVLLWAGRGAGFSPDELTWFANSPDLDLSGALQPHVGHLLLTTRLVYKAIFELFGVDYVLFRVLTAVTVIGAGALFYAYVSRRIGAIAALAPTAILLVFGSDATHMILGNGFTVVGSVACGIGALLALDRGDRRGDVIACVLLCLGVATYTTALAFVVGIGISIVIRGDRWQRIWIVAIPVALYAAWWLWALGQPASSESQIVISDVLLFPAWAFQSLAADLSAIVGLDYQFSSEATSAAGTVLAFAAIGAIAWRIRRGSVPPLLWATIGTALALWLMGAISQTELRQPDSSRYLYPGAAIVLLIGAGVVAGWLPKSRATLIAIFAIFGIGVATNLALLRDGGDLQRGFGEVASGEIAGLAVAGTAADPDFVPQGGSANLRFALGAIRDEDLAPTETFLAATRAYGIPGDQPDELGSVSDAAGAGADATLIGALGIALEPTEADAADLDCVAVAAGADLTIEPGDTAILIAGDQDATVSLRRFASATPTAVGPISAGSAASLALPVDSSDAPWHLSTSAPLQACVGS